jgi:drug/metabolite transporter (DMT)-like permease
VVVMIAIWGTTWAAIRIGLEGIPPLHGVALRFALAGVLLWAFALAIGLRGSRLLAPPRVWAIHGVFSFCISYGLVYWAEQWVPSGLAAVLFATFPLFVALIAHWALPGERLTLAGIGGSLVAFGGVAVIFSEDFQYLGGPEVAFPAAVLLLAPLASAVANVAVKKWGSGAHPVPLNAGSMVMAAMLMAPLARVVERQRPVVFDAVSVGALLYLAVLGTAVTFTLYFWLLRHTPATRLALITYALPVVAVAVGALGLGEPVTWKMALGGALVVGGVGWAMRRPPRRRA